jgi:hypothetical protein
MATDVQTPTERDAQGCGTDASSCPATSWTDLPHEVVFEVATHIKNLASLSMLATAADVRLVESWPRLVLARMGPEIDFGALLASGAPLEVVLWRYTQGNSALTLDMLPSAAAGGRVEVVRWVHDLIQNEHGEALLLEDHLNDIGNSKTTTEVKDFGAIVAAVSEAARNRRLEALAWLLVNPLGGSGPSSAALCTIIADAARAGHVDVVEVIHDMHCVSPGDLCPYGRLLARTAFEADQVGVLAWLAKRPCTPAFAVGRRHIETALSRRQDNVLAWIRQEAAPHLEPGWRYFHRTILHDPDALESLAYAHDRFGFTIPTVALIAAAAEGRMELLSWACGETTVDGRDDGDAQKTLSTWDPAPIVIQAAASGHDWIVERLLTREDVRGSVRPITVARAATRGRRPGLAARLVPFDRWHDLTAAVSDGSDATRFAAALRHGTPLRIDRLYQTCGPVPMAEAIAALDGVPCNPECIDRIIALQADPALQKIVCVADACATLVLSGKWSAYRRCRCCRCCASPLPTRPTVTHRDGNPRASIG